MPIINVFTVPLTQMRINMKLLFKLLFAIALNVVNIGMSVVADNNDPLFINLTTDNSHRADMAISFGNNQLKRGHPLTIFLNDKGVFIGSKENSAKFVEQQKMLGELMNKGATLLICRMCMKHYDVKETDLLPGLKMSNPDITGNALFQDNTKTLSW